MTEPILVRISRMNTLPRSLFRPSRRALIALSGLLLLLTAAALTGCGDGDTTSTDPAGTTSAEPTAPAGGDAVTSTDLEPGSGGAGIPDMPENDDPSAVQCTGAPKQVFDATAIVGEPIDEATRQARDAGCDVRVVVEDGKPLAVTDDFRPDRIDVVVSDGEVEKIDGLY